MSYYHQPMIFLSGDLPDQYDDTYPKIRYRQAKNALATIASLTEIFDCLVATRDETGLKSPLIEQMGIHNPRLKVLPFGERREDFVLENYPKAVFYIAGHNGVEEDYAWFKRCPDILSIPLPETGGCAVLVDEWQRAAGLVPLIIKGNGGPSFDRIRIQRTVAHLNDAATDNNLREQLLPD